MRTLKCPGHHKLPEESVRTRSVLTDRDVNQEVRRCQASKGASATASCGGTPASEGTALWVWHLQQAATGISAARRLGAALAAGTIGDMQEWVDLQMMIKAAFRRPETVGLSREFLAEIITNHLRACNVRPLARWSDGRFATIFEADGLLGVVAIQLARKIAHGETAYLCELCGQPVECARPPLPDEVVYCKRPECKREQQRRNQAAWRAR